MTLPYPQVMDLVCRLDTRQEAKEMLLDDFMGGFLYKLVVQKWQKFARHYHSLNILFGAIQLFGLFMLVMDKRDPWRPRGHMPILALTIVLVPCVYQVT